MGRLFAASCGFRAKLPSWRRTPLYYSSFGSNWLFTLEYATFWHKYLLQMQTTSQNTCVKTWIFNEEWIFITLKGKACMKLNHYISDWVLKFFEISRTRLVFSFKSIQMNENIHEFIFPSELNLTIFFLIPIACCSTLNFKSI